MQVNLDDSTDIIFEKVKDKESFELRVDSRTKITFSKSEAKFLFAMMDSALKEDEGLSREALQKSLKDAASKHKALLQNTLRNIKSEDIALAVWYMDDQSFAADVMANISKRSAEDVQTAVKESIERRIRKERSEGKEDIEEIMLEKGRSSASALLKKLLDA